MNNNRYFGRKLAYDGGEPTDGQEDALLNAAQEVVSAQKSKSGSGGASSGSSNGFSYGNAPAYASRYQGQINDLTKQLLNRDGFSYDPEKDPLYQQYRASYTRDGQRAMQDTLGQVSARTGGLASSYAGSAAQQTYGNYMAALNDKIPELERLAYEMYRDEGKDLQDRLSFLIALDGDDYGRYKDLMAQRNNDRNFNYGLLRDEISDWRYADETEHIRALTKAQLLAAAGDFSGYKVLGYSDEEIGKLQEAYKQGKGTQGTGGNQDGASSYSQLLKAGIVDEFSAYDWLVNNTELSHSEADQLAKNYKYWLHNYIVGTFSSDDSYKDPVMNYVDMNSLEELGLGNISASRLEELGELGFVDFEETEDGKIKVVKGKGLT